MATKIVKTEDHNASSFNFRDYLVALASHWKWFLISILVICGYTTVAVITTEPTYLRTEQLLIKSEQNGGSSEAISNVFNTMGLGSTKTNVYNEMISLKSPALLSQVVQKLDLCTDITQLKFPYDVSLYGKTLPFRISFVDLDPEQALSMEIKVHPDGKCTLGKFVKVNPDGAEDFDDELSVSSLFSTYSTPLGKVSITPNPLYVQPVTETPKKELTYSVSRSSLHDKITYYQKNLKVDLTDRDADVIDLTLEDVNVDRASDILRTIVDIYNMDWIVDRNRISSATSEFINERLASLETELGSLDSDIMDFRSNTMTPDLEEAAKVNLKSTSDLTFKDMELRNQLAMTEYLKEFLNNPANDNAVIPLNIGTGSMDIEAGANAYNQLLMARDNLVASTSPTNPLVLDYNTQLKGLRKSAVDAVDAQLIQLRKSIANVQGLQGKITGNLKSGPQQAKVLLSQERRQKVMEELYLYLLTKREENSLSQKFTAENTRIITPPFGPNKPISPRKKLSVAIAFLIALILPAALIYVMEAMDSHVRSRRDLENMSAPFTGEIPLHGRRKHFEWLRKRLASRKKKSHKKLESLPVTVEAGKRDVINESFRIVRSNIDLMMRSDDTSNIIMMTSFNPGSGKSFITFNLAASFAIKGKKALIIDCDLRHGSTSQYVGMPPKGLTSYLTGATDDWKKLVVADRNTEGLYVLPIGHRPPNPAELLENGRIGEMLAEASADFDYVLLDCPPIDVVVDTQLLEKYAGLTIFVVRAGLLQRSAVAEIDEMYRNHRFRRMSILLNGTEGANSRAATYGSSYYSNDFK